MNAGEWLHRSSHQTDLKKIEVADFARSCALLGASNPIPEAQARQATLFEFACKNPAELVVMQSSDDLQAAPVLGEMLDTTDDSSGLMLP